MASKTNQDFEGSKNKNVLRQEWDRPILVSAIKSQDKLLSYFGLPGPHIEDLIAWKDLIQASTGVERLRPSGQLRQSDLEKHRRMLRNVLTNEIERFQLLRGEIEDVITDGSDVDGYLPQLNDNNKPQRMRFQYTLVNLDFLGGLGYLDGHNESKQVKALKKLFERQSGTDFTLLITVNVRDGIPSQLVEYLQKTCNRVDKAIRPIVQWYATRKEGEKAYILKAVVPLLVQSAAELQMFEVYAYPPVSYHGTGENMVHFAFSLRHTQKSIQGFSQQHTADLLNLPLVFISDGKLTVANKQHTHFNFEGCKSIFDFLPQEARLNLIDTLPH